MTADFVDRFIMLNVHFVISRLEYMLDTIYTLYFKLKKDKWELKNTLD